MKFPQEAVERIMQREAFGRSNGEDKRIVEWKCQQLVRVDSKLHAESGVKEDRTTTREQPGHSKLSHQQLMSLKVRRWSQSQSASRVTRVGNP